MRILVAGDTHGCLALLREILRQKKENIGLFVHTGDCFEDGRKLADEAGLPFEGVRGNCDGFRDRDAPEERLFEFAGRKILLVHGHGFAVKRDFLQLYYRAQETKADIVLFGHTHIPVWFEYHGIIFGNPGSFHRPGTERGFSYLEIVFGEKTVSGKIRYTGFRS